MPGTPAAGDAIAASTPPEPGFILDGGSDQLSQQVLAAARVQAAARLIPGVDTSTALDRLASLAARQLSSSSSQISLLASSQIVAGGAGLPPGSVHSSSPLEDSLCTATVESGGPLLVRDAPADERVAHLPPVVSGAVVSYLGVPLAMPDGPAVGALCVFDTKPHRWTAQDVAVLEQLAEAVLAVLELAALSAEYASSRQRWDIAVEAAGIGSFDWDLTTDRVDWDERLQAMFGYAPGEFVPHITNAFARIDAEDRPALDAAIAAAIESCGDYKAEFRVQLPNRQQRWLSARGRAHADADGRPARLLGGVFDITESRSVKDRAAQVLATMATGFVSVDRDWCVTYVNATGERIVGLTSENLVGCNLWEVFPGLEDIEFGRTYHRAMNTGETVELEAYYGHLNGWFEVRAVPGNDGLALYFLDITARRADQQAAHEARLQAEEAAARLQLLASVSAGLAASLEAEPAVAGLAQLVVPLLADWSVVTLLGEGGAMRDVGSWYLRDGLGVVEKQGAELLAHPGVGGLVQRATSSGKPAVVTLDALERDGSRSTEPEADSASADASTASCAAVPIVARGEVAGVFVLYRHGDRPQLSAEELATAADIAARAGLALENSRLYREQQSLAEGLQRSLLTLPPEPDHCQIVVRYLPAAEVASVGGDWFDAFLQADGSTVLVIGDVVGHDTAAAAAMGQVRGLLRGIAWHSGAGPADVLTGLDAAIQGLQVETTASVVVVRVEQTPEEQQRGVTHLRWSNAGHPPPMVIDTDGTVTALAGLEADLLLGIDPSTDRAESRIALDRGTTVLLYTDGLIERRSRGLDEGLALLRDTLTELAELDLDELCDELIKRMLSNEAEDDVALVALRLHRQDVPRPAEAGPEAVPGVVPAHP